MFECPVSTGVSTSILILQVEMLEERVEPKGKVNVIMCSHTAMPRALGKELAAFGAVVKQMLEDVQQRLTFKAQVCVISTTVCKRWCYMKFKT